ncbi:hypothetical protein WME94_20270 [Sorangium sp. So ce429]
MVLWALNPGLTAVGHAFPVEAVEPLYKIDARGQRDRIEVAVVACDDAPSSRPRELDGALKLAREAGADEVILYGQTDFAREARRLTGGAGVHVVYDSRQDDLRGEPRLAAPARLPGALRRDRGRGLDPSGWELVVAEERPRAVEGRASMP